MKFVIIPQDTSIKKPFWVGIAIILIAVAAIAVFWSKLPPQIPLFFSKPRGETQLAPTYMIFIPLGISLILLFINSIFSQALNNFSLLRQMIILGAVTGCILAAITVIRIILLVVY
jgi:hypothetical protein